jgi:hypothetical protein
MTKMLEQRNNGIKIDEATWRSIRALVIYLAPDEGKHYEESGKPQDHIFREVMKVSRWLDKNRLVV